MPLIEGFGDEVTLLLFAFLVGIIIVLAWMSTQVDSRFLVPIIILDRERFSVFMQRLRVFTEQRLGEREQQQREGSPTTENSTEAGEDGAGSRDDESRWQRVQDVSLRDDQSSESESRLHPSVDSLPDSSHVQSKGSRDTSCSLSETSVNEELNSSALDADIPLSGAESISSSLEQQVPCSPTSDGNQGSSESSANNEDHAAIPEGHIQIRLQYIDGRQRIVTAKLDDTIGEFKRNHFSAELAGHSIVRFVMSGKELRDDSSTLRFYQVSNGSVIHCLITAARVEPVVTAVDSNQFEIGFLMLPLFGFLLTLLWYARIAYRSYFSGASTCSLVAISFLYLIALVGSFRSHRVNHHHQD